MRHGRRGLAKPKLTRAWWFKVKFEDRNYNCTDKHGSLKVGSRRELYCPDCDAPECLFGGLTFKQVQAGAKPPEQKVVSKAKSELYSRSAKRRAANKRAQGLAPSGKPLAETCWNCSNVREDTTGFVCQLKPLDRPVGKWCVSQRRAERMGCGAFDVRLYVEIRKLGDE